MVAGGGPLGTKGPAVFVGGIGVLVGVGVGGWLPPDGCVLVAVAVAVGGTGVRVAVGGTAVLVAVGAATVLVAVAVGGTGVLVGGTAVFVAVAVGGATVLVAVAVGGTGVLVAVDGAGVAVGVAVQMGQSGTTAVGVTQGKGVRVAVAVGGTGVSVVVGVGVAVGGMGVSVGVSVAVLVGCGVGVQVACAMAVWVAATAVWVSRTMAVSVADHCAPRPEEHVASALANDALWLAVAACVTGPRPVLPIMPARDSQPKSKTISKRQKFRTPLCRVMTSSSQLLARPFSSGYLLGCHGGSRYPLTAAPLT